MVLSLAFIALLRPEGFFCLPVFLWGRMGFWSVQESRPLERTNFMSIRG